MTMLSNPNPAVPPVTENFRVHTPSKESREYAKCSQSLPCGPFLEYKTVGLPPQLRMTVVSLLFVPPLLRISNCKVAVFPFSKANAGEVTVMSGEPPTLL